MSKISVTEEIISEFEGKLSWSYAVKNRAEIKPLPAVYAIVSTKEFSRVLGVTRILYIGKTKCLGGKSDRARLYAYCYPSGAHGRLMKSRIENLCELGWDINLYWRHVESEEDARTQESNFLNQHLEDHLEFPPFNGKK